MWSPTFQRHAPEVRCFARRLLHSDLNCGGVPNLRRFRAAERAGWPVGRAGTATCRAGVWGPGQVWPEGYVT
eukprot:14510222-Alexandrium_andersonii.AAC.1